MSYTAEAGFRPCIMTSLVIVNVQGFSEAVARTATVQSATIIAESQDWLARASVEVMVPAAPARPSSLDMRIGRPNGIDGIRRLSM